NPTPPSQGSHPKPSISVRPGGVIPVGGNVTIRCRHQRLGMRILLYKDGDWNYLTHTDPAGSEAEFPITGARREHGGSYTCRYSNRTGPAGYSEPSDPVQIIVAGEGLPRPSIALSLASGTASGSDVTIRCQGQRRDVRFFLHKAGDLNPQRHMDPAGAGAEFRIPTVGREHRGSYSCSYRPRSEPFVSSQPSDPVQLLVAGERPGSVPPLGAPSPTPSPILRGSLHQWDGRPAGERGRSHGVPQSRGPLPQRTLVLFPQGEPTRPSLERRRLPPAWAARGQVPGSGGIY
uniref:Ig-like domain-containing protein n=1 Tax=Chelydra serpentina TaxID=8475 RepID=A0A8C3RVL1_CHESE